MGRVICITGIDTDIGKTVVTGLLGKYLSDRDLSVITQKICQTGCQGDSTDIFEHRKIMGMEPLEEDLKGITCPYVFAEPASPHLAAQLYNSEIHVEKLAQATNILTRKFDYVLLEGVGGLMVPLNSEVLLVDYLKEQNYEHILVTSSRLGSINHTLSALEILQSRGIQLNGLIYNRFFDDNPRIAEDSSSIFSRYLPQYGHRPNIIEITEHGSEFVKEEYDFSALFSD